MKKNLEPDRVIKNFTQYVSGTISRHSDKNDVSSASVKEFLSSMATWAGKGKDELVQVICREIGTATASVLKEPLSKLLENKKLQITIELVSNEPPKKKAGKKSRDPQAESP